MSESVVFVGGYSAFMATLMLALVIVFWLPSSFGNARIRVGAFFVLWQVFTPIQPWHFDLPAMVGSMLALELLYRAGLRWTR